MVEVAFSSRRLGLRIAVVSVSTLVMGFLAPVASAATQREILLQDRCEAATFNAAVGAGTCIGNGDVTFAEFSEDLNPHDFGHGAWRASREKTSIDRGGKVSVHNTGGEVHTFTEVPAFGPGIVPVLNEPLGLTGEPVAPIGDPRFLEPGARLSFAPNPGVHRYQCLIHPWMRTTLSVNG